MSRRYVTLDVFTDRRFGGNPLGVVFDADGLDTGDMQAIAREFNYSETTFLLPPRDPSHTATLRIFTPAREVPFAGHPNIGTALAVAWEGELFGKPVKDEIIFDEKAGRVRIALTHENGRAVSAELTAPEPFKPGGEVSAEFVARCAGLRAGDIITTRHQPVAASVGLPFTFAELTDMSALERAAIGPDETFKALPLNAHDLMIYVRTGEGQVRARMFGPLDAVPEDPATGSACAALMGLTAHLDDRADGEITLSIRQGVEMGRPSRIEARARKSGGEVTEVRVSGGAVTVMEGRLLD